MDGLMVKVPGQQIGRAPVKFVGQRSGTKRKRSENIVLINFTECLRNPTAAADSNLEGGSPWMEARGLLTTPLVRHAQPLK
jgi:hypothetical protein